MRVPRVLLVAGSKGKRGMDEIAIDIIDLQSPTARVEGGFDPLRTMIVIPELRGDEHILPLNPRRLERFLHRIANRCFIAVAFRTIEISKSNFQCGLRSLFGRDRIGDQRAKPDSGDRTRTVGKRNPRIAKRIGGRHARTPLFEESRRISCGRLRYSIRSGSIRLTERADRQQRPQLVQ